MNKGLPGPVMYKNRLQEYIQKLGISLPEYRIRNEGFTHAPKFKSCVLVNGKNYVSGGTFPKRKEAEQDAAKVGLENITETRNDGGNPSIQDPTYCKLILFEYAVKMNLKRPEYSTTGGEQMRPVFMSTLFFDGKVYKGEEARSQKPEDSRTAGCMRCHSITPWYICMLHLKFMNLLSNGKFVPSLTNLHYFSESDSGILQQIINSKSRVQDAVPEVKNPSANQSNLPAPSTLVSSWKANDVSVKPSTFKLMSSCSTVNCSSENKRKPQTSDSTQKKLRRHLQ
ncbi:hypothetical protein Pint_17019 [Pistacia integerrima]|uniref:Uncharacterized protein n=1 Tax=Pistacia integerrima TaxID=434235 RepID=A0ACC0ZAP6_9ROSI|nr:hypothetical protein Pint_17019 [Pistacia integerrima]